MIPGLPALPTFPRLPKLPKIKMPKFLKNVKLPKIAGLNLGSLNIPDSIKLPKLGDIINGRYKLPSLKSVACNVFTPSQSVTGIASKLGVRNPCAPGGGGGGQHPQYPQPEPEGWPVQHPQPQGWPAQPAPAQPQGWPASSQQQAWPAPVGHPLVQPVVAPQQPIALPGGVKLNLNINVNNAQHSMHKSSHSSSHSSSQKSSHESSSSSSHKSDHQSSQKNEAAAPVIVNPVAPKPEIIIITDAATTTTSPAVVVVRDESEVTEAPKSCVRAARLHCGMSHRALPCRTCFQKACTPCSYKEVAKYRKSSFKEAKPEAERVENDDKYCNMKKYARKLQQWRNKRGKAMEECDSAGDASAVDSCVRQCISDFYDSRPARPPCAPEIEGAKPEAVIYRKKCASLKTMVARLKCRLGFKRKIKGSTRVKTLNTELDWSNCANLKKFSQRFKCRQARRLAIAQKTKRHPETTDRDCTQEFEDYRVAVLDIRRDRALSIKQCRQLGKDNTDERRGCLVISVKLYEQARLRIKRPDCKRSAGDKLCNQRLADFRHLIQEHNTNRRVAISGCRKKQKCIADIVADFAKQREYIVKPACARRSRRNGDCVEAKSLYKKAIFTHEAWRRGALADCGKDLACVERRVKEYKKKRALIPLPKCAPRVEATLRRLRKCERLKSRKARVKCRTRAKRAVNSVPSKLSRRTKALKRCLLFKDLFQRRTCTNSVHARYPTRIARVTTSRVKEAIAACPNGNAGCACRAEVVKQHMKICDEF